MKILNRTHWRTDQLRAILQRCAEMELEPAKRKHITVTVSYRRRGGGSSGCAYIGGRWCRVRVSSDVFDSRDFAKVACHEFAHLRGMRHRQMPAYYKRNHIGGTGDGHERYAWATSMVVERKAKKARPTGAALARERHAHVLTMVAKAQTRFKRAQTLLRKWKTKQRYYEKRLAAMEQGDGQHV